MNDLVKQNDPRMPEDVRRWGCRFMSLLAIPQLFVGKALTAEQILVIYQAGKKDPRVIGAECTTGADEHVIMELGLFHLGAEKLRARQVGRMKGAEAVFWNGRKEYQYILGHWDTGGVDGHYTLFAKDGAELYDPWDAAIGGKLNKKLVDKRFLYYVWEVKGA